MIEYARIMTKQEVNSFYSFLKSKQEIKFNINPYRDVLIKEYHNYEKCIIEYYNKTKYYNVEEIYLSHILKKVGLNGKLKMKQLYDFYLENGLVDLRIKYGKEPVTKLINRYIKTKKSCKNEENEIVEYLSKMFPKSIKQLPIKYKLKGQKEKKCFVDLVLSNDEYIFVIEIKTNSYSIDNNQLELYESLIKFINKDDRKIYPLFICYNGEWERSNKFIQSNFDYIKKEVKDDLDLQEIAEYGYIIK